MNKVEMNQTSIGLGIEWVMSAFLLGYLLVILENAPPQ